MNKEVVIISDLSESSGGTFAATAHVEARFSCYFHILFTSRTSQNSHVEALCLQNLCSWKNQKRKKVLGEKEKNTGPKKRERVPFWQEKKKILRESDWQWRSSTLASKFRTKKSPSKQNLPYIMLKTRFPFLSACLATKT